MSRGESALPLAHGQRLIEESTFLCKGRAGFGPGCMGWKGARGKEGQCGQRG